MSHPMADHMKGLMAVSFRSEPRDQYARMTAQWQDDDGCTTMPPSPGVQHYRLRVIDYGGHIEYEGEVVWCDWMAQLVREMEPWQRTHRSRAFAIAASKLRMNEIGKRVAQTYQHRGEYERLALDDRTSYELFAMVLEETIKHLNLNYDHVLTYIKSHEMSSTGEGRKWFESYNLNREDWADLYRLTRDVIERMQHSPGQWNDLDWFFGMRARSNEVASFTEKYTGQIDRTRVIMFRLALSIWTLFIPNKVSWYKSIMARAIDILGIHAKIVLPYVVGGAIYVEAAEQFANGAAFKAYDGKSWESGVGILLGKAFRPFMVHVRRTAQMPTGSLEYELFGVDMLPSGITVTSLLGTLAMLVAVRHCSGVFIILGDDCNSFDAKGVPKVWFLEFQPGDTAYKYILGVSYGVDPYKPRLTGIRITMDRAGKMQRVRMDGGVGVYSCKRDPLVRATWALMYKALYGQKTLYEAISKIPAGEYTNPEEMVERIATSPEIPVDEIVASAKAEGLGDIFVAMA